MEQKGSGSKYPMINNFSSASQEPGTKKIYSHDGYQYLTLEQYKAFISQQAKQMQPNFEVDEAFKKVLTPLVWYFWEDERFETEGYGSLKKGLFIAGNTGTGKTTLMKLFRYNPVKQLNLVSTSSMCDTYQQHGLERLLDQVEIRAHHYACYCYDDLGAETIPIRHMGNEINVMQRIILERYDRGCPHNLTHFTSNLDGPQIELIYGARVKSRLNEMVNFFELKGGDRRK